MIGYRFTAAELSCLIGQTGERRFRLFDIDSGETGNGESRAADSLCKKGVMKKTGGGWSVDRVIWVLAYAVSHAETYVLAASEKSAAAIGGRMTVLLQKSGGNTWKLYPYQTVRDMFMSEHSKYPPDSKWTYVSGTEHTEMRWAEFLERMMQNEQGAGDGILCGNNQKI